MKNAPEQIDSPGRSWRSIRQEVSSPAMSRRGRRRRLMGWLKVGALCVSAGAVLWAAVELVHSWETDRMGLTTAVHSAPVRESVVITDGVLTQKWAIDALALPKGASLMSLDLNRLREKLLSYGQIRVAVLTRSFPDTLVITMQERSPVARVQAEDASGQTKQFLVAKDGTVYEGHNYEKSLLATLPWLDGVRLVKQEGGFAPIDGMTEVTTLLTTAQLQAPHLYRGWLIVSLARLVEADEIVVKAQDVPEIVFTRKRDFFKQIAQLDYVIDASHVLPAPQLQSVNLTFEGQVPVRMQPPTNDKAGAPHRPELPFQPSNRTTNRDL